jgi:hypothetical protein
MGAIAVQGQLSLDQPLFAGLSPQDISLIMGQTASRPPNERWGAPPGGGGYQPPMMQPLPGQGDLPPLDSLELLKAISQV